jgi:hypothetical protein
MSFDKRTSEEGATILHWSCDDCGAWADFETESFSGAWATLKEERWSAAKDRNNEWLHQCPKCRKTMTAAEFLART